MCSKKDCPFSEEIHKMDKIIFGNGSEGLLGKVAKVQTITKVIVGLNVSILLAILANLFI